MKLRNWLGHAERADLAMRHVSHAANSSRIWIGTAGLLALGGGGSGPRAAFDGLTSIAVTSVVVNAALEPLGRRPRPERGPLVGRHVRLVGSLLGAWLGQVTLRARKWREP